MSMNKQFFAENRIDLNETNKLPDISILAFAKYDNETGGIYMNFKKWIKAAGIRALKTVAQTAVATIGTTAVINQVDWIVVLSASALAGILSLLTSVGGLPEIK